MAIAVDQNYDKAQRKISTANLAQFAGVDCQLLVEKETHRPVVMNGTTLGGAFKCASTAEVNAVKATADSALTKAQADQAYLGINDEAQSSKSVEWTGVQNVPETIANALSYLAQTLTTEQKQQVMANLADTWLPLSGGTMAGTIKQETQFALSRATDNARLEILGGTSVAGGASLYLSGVNRSKEPGTFSLTARDNNGNSKQLRGESNGSLTWGGKNVVRSVNDTSADARGNVAISIQKFAPDYDAVVSISNFPYTVPSDGYIRFCVDGNNYGGVSVNNNVNDTTDFQIAGGVYSEKAIIPVSKGDVIHSNNNNAGRFFIPCKGA